MLPLVVEPDALEPLLGDARLLLVDLCADATFARWHLPGAVHISPSALVSGIKPATGKLPPVSRLEKLLGGIGLREDRHVVVYDDEGGGWAGRFIWTLDVIGHGHGSYLNGGLIAWAKARLPLTRQVTTVTPTTLSLAIDRAPIAEKEDVLAAITDPDTLIWDARSPEEYAGAKVTANRGGHVPGAINLDWLELMDRDRDLRLRRDLREVVSARGLDRGRAVITHCQTHHRSGLAYLAGRLLGLNIRAYHGSWSEWGNDPDTPITNPSAPAS